MVVLDTLTGMAVLCAAVLLAKTAGQGQAGLALPKEYGLAVISVLLVVLSVLGAFETPTVQACIPQMPEGDDIVRGMGFLLC